jgi:single-strand DNA-binding protein
MAGFVNKVTLIGNLGRDPEVRQTQGGEDIVHLSIATSETWRDQASGERKQRTEWHRVVIFNDNLGKVAKAYLKKGAKVYLEGTLQTRKWTDQQGIEKYTTEVVLPRFRGELVMLDGRDDSGGGNGAEEFDPETGEVIDRKKEAHQPVAPVEKKRSAGRSRR